MRKILFYFAHQESLGHTTRLLSIIHTLRNKYKEKIDLFVFQGGKPQEYLFYPSGVKWFNLPFPFYSRLNFRTSPNLIFPNIRSRINFMLSKIERINPDIFITEYFPFGRRECRYELLPVLKYLKRNKVSIYASVGYPCFNQDSIKTLLPSFNSFYKKIFIHVPENTETNYFYQKLNSQSEKNFYLKILSQLKEKVIYTGYILPYGINNRGKEMNVVKEKICSENKKFILVSRGAGAYYPKLISHSILAKRYLNNNYVFLIVAGPSTSKKEMILFKKCLKEAKSDSIYLKKFMPDLSDFLKIADLSISTAAYNTSVQLLYFSKKSIIIPFSGYSLRKGGYKEQISRAQMLKEYLGANILDYENMNPKILAQEIEKSIKEKPKFKKIRREKWFNGAEITANLIMDG